MKSGHFLAKASNTAYDVWFRYSDTIYKLCLLKCNKDEEKARDFYQEVFLKFSQHARQVAEHPAPYYWFKSVINNEFSNIWRKNRRREELVKENEQLWCQKTSDEFQECMEMELSFITCTPLEKMILEFIQAGFSIPELSKILGLSSMAIRRRLKKLKTQLLRGPTSLEKE